MKNRRVRGGVVGRSRVRDRRLSREEVRAQALARTELSAIGTTVPDVSEAATTEPTPVQDGLRGKRSGRRGGWRRSRKSSLASWSRALLTLGAGALVVTGVRVVAIADDHAPTSQSEAITSPEFTRRPYVGVGAGISRLEPRRPTSALTIDDNQGTGAHVMVGYDIERWLSAELYFADLGEADIGFLGTPVGEVGYQVFGATALAYLYNSRSGSLFSDSTDGLHRREGLSVYGRFGIGGMQNDTDLEYRRDYASHAVFGLGVEYGFRNGFALRAELEGFDTDARYASASVLKRFGKVKTSAPVAVAQQPVEPAPIVAPPETPTQFRPVVPPYVYFAFDDASLSDEARDKLASFVEAINDSETNLNIHVEGHTDWIGGESYNDALSLRRATTVRDHLVSLGIDSDRIQAVGLGESFPLSNNSTAQGRAENRRAELRLK